MELTTVCRGKVQVTVCDLTKIATEVDAEFLVIPVEKAYKYPKVGIYANGDFLAHSY